jgi:hypothetical protein
MESISNMIIPSEKYKIHNLKCWETEISQIEFMYNKSEEQINNTLIVTSMGNKSEEGDLSIHFLTLKANKVIAHKIVNLDERIRDIIFIKEKNKYILFLESSTSIGIIDLNNISN